MPTLLPTRTATFTSPLGGQVELYSMTGREAFSRPFVYEVDLLSESDSVDLSALLGKKASVMLERTDGTWREFNGYVTHFSMIGEHGNYVRYRAVMRPWLWFLGQNLNSRVFQPATVPDAVTTLFRDRGFSDIEAAFIPSAYRKWDYLVQYRESDLNFVSRLLEQEGIHYFFKHEGGKHTIVLADSNSAHKTAAGYAKVPYFPPLEHERRQEEHLDAWVTSRQVRAGAFATGEFHFTKPTVITSSVSRPLKTLQEKNELYEYPGQFTEDPKVDAKAEADTLVDIRLQENQVEHELAQGGGAVRGLMAGNRFTLTQFPRDDQNKEYVIISASYEIQVSEFESNVAAEREAHMRFELVAIDAKVPYRPPRVTKKPVVEGPQTAIVVGKDQQEISTDEYGRVKVQFHWDRNGPHNENSSCWVRVSQIWAGQQWGAMHIPRVGHEVIVQFLEGDPDRPIVTGRVYNEENKPPYGLTANRTQSGIKSRSTSGGGPDNFNEIRFEDKKDHEELYLQAEKDMLTLVKNDQTTNVKHDRIVNVTNNDTLDVSGDCKIHIKGNLAFTVDGQSDSSSPIKSSMGITGAYNMNASDSVSITAPNKITLTSSGSSITIEPGKITIASSAGAKLVLDSNVLLQSNDGSKVVLDANAFVQASGKAQVLLDANVLAKSNDGSKVVLDANALTQSSGGAKVILDSNVTVKGGTVKIN